MGVRFLETEEWTTILLRDTRMRGVVYEGSEILENIEKESRISAEIKRLTKLFKNIDKNKLKTVKSLIENVAFMTITLDDLQLVINEKGCVEEYQNGQNQKGYKKSSEVEVYNTMIKNYSTIMKQLIELSPSSGSDSNELLKYVSGGGAK